MQQVISMQTSIMMDSLTFTYIVQKRTCSSIVARKTKHLNIV